MSLTLVPGSGVSRTVPDTVRALLSLPRVDYADRYVLATAANAAPERWARTMFGDVPTVAERFIWRGVLGLRLHRAPSPEMVGGWRIGGRGADWIRLEAESWFLQANMLVQTGNGQVSWTTALRYVRPLADVLWPPASALHRRLVPRVLSAAARRLR